MKYNTVQPIGTTVNPADRLHRMPEVGVTLEGYLVQPLPKQGPLELLVQDHEDMAPE